MIELKEITRDNYLECLGLKVKQEQDNMVATNSFSLAQAKFHPECVPLAVYSGNAMVGFVMYCLDADDGNYWIWRLMIDREHQGKGFGREAMTALLQRMRQQHNCDLVLISFQPDNVPAERLYSSLGFMHTGREVDGEIVMQLRY